MRVKHAGELAGMARRALRRWERRPEALWPAVAAAMGRALLGGEGAAIAENSAAPARFRLAAGRGRSHSTLAAAIEALARGRRRDPRCRWMADCPPLALAAAGGS